MKTAILKEKTINNVNIKLAKRSTMWIVQVKIDDVKWFGKGYSSEFEANLVYGEKLRAIKVEATSLSLRNK